MTAQTQATSVRTSLVVAAPIERAFTVFTEGMATWWPPEHHILQTELAEMVFEPRVGGNIYDRGVDGSECRWARVLAYEPPAACRVQLGHQPGVGARDRPRQDERGRDPLHDRIRRSHARRSRTPPSRAPRRGMGGDAQRGRLP